jgi:hypothetical protein
MQVRPCRALRAYPLALSIRAAGLATALAALSGVEAVQSATYYVSPAGKGSGVSAGSPRGAQAALNTVRDGDTLIFLDGTYPALSLTNRDLGPGLITLRAQRPALTGIDTAAGTPSGLRATGAVLAGSGGTRGLYIDGHDGLVIDGLKFISSGQGLAIKNSKNVVVSRNHFHEHSTMGFVVTGNSTAVRVTQNYFTNQRTATVGNHMDYGLYASHNGTLTVDANLIVGLFNQGMSLKMFVTEATFTRNVFRCARGSCLMLGQEADLRYGNGSLLDRTVGKVTVSGNRFENIGYVALFVSNVEDVSIAGNSFTNVSSILYDKYDVARSTPTGAATSAGRLPRRVRFVDNTISRSRRIWTEGRGTLGETVTISGNKLESPIDCRILPMSTAGIVVGEQTAGYPTVLVSNRGLTCRRH